MGEWIISFGLNKPVGDKQPLLADPLQCRRGGSRPTTAHRMPRTNEISCPSANYGPREGLRHTPPTSESNGSQLCYKLSSFLLHRYPSEQAAEAQRCVKCQTQKGDGSTSPPIYITQPCVVPVSRQGVRAADFTLFSP